MYAALQQMADVSNLSTDGRYTLNGFSSLAVSGNRSQSSSLTDLRSSVIRSRLSLAESRRGSGSEEVTLATLRSGTGSGGSTPLSGLFPFRTSAPGVSSLPWEFVHFQQRRVGAFGRHPPGAPSPVQLTSLVSWATSRALVCAAGCSEIAVFVASVSVPGMRL